ncbi:kynureninase-like isoform X2 [Parasteatoda tepidariorum]|uniref:kynureninase-like isoform X2 n=1 Tax=Parasteatoda tepidariorum TaxID=114398 RepID=UPI001C717D9E|nr:kynureninase-like isoform X2 [Parasteatoda tepidariorum]
MANKMINLESSLMYNEFIKKSQKWSSSMDSLEFAKRMDKEDPLGEYRKLFNYPKKKDISGVCLRNISDGEEECIYLCGQSLGLQLKSTESKVQDALNNWAIRGVDSHFTGEFPAALSDQPLKEQMANLVGAETNEIAFMNALTVNIHFMLASFYRPSENRYKILMVEGGFHSDLYAVQSHVKLRGYDPEESIVFLKPEEGEHIVRPQKVLSFIKEEGENIALIYLEGVHYYTGQLFDMKAITKAGHEQGCMVGFDLAHAVGNVKLKLHEWNIDFAVWCSYKYLNSGAGNMGAIFCHSKHTQGANQIMPALRGWWGLDFKRKFTFDKEFTAAAGADRFRLSNPSPILCAMISNSLNVFNKVGMDKIQAKQRLITGYLEYLLRKLLMMSSLKNSESAQIQIITPRDPKERGSQISLLSSIPISQCEELLKSHGIVCDIRSPSVLRVTPAPLYNTFTEVYKFAHFFKDAWETIQSNESREK